MGVVLGMLALVWWVFGVLGCWWYALAAVFVVSVNCAIYGCLGFIIGFMGLCVDCLFCLFVLVCCFSWLVIVVLLLVIACLWFGILVLFCWFLDCVFDGCGAVYLIWVAVVSAGGLCWLLCSCYVIVAI